jgi:hypothetical protein
MNRVCLVHQCRLHQKSSIQVTFGGTGMADAYAVVGHLDSQRIGVRFGVNLYGFYPQLLARAYHTNRDLATIRD